MTNTALIKQAHKVAHAYNIAADGSQRKADMLARYMRIVAKLGFDPLM